MADSKYDLAPLATGKRAFDHYGCAATSRQNAPVSPEMFIIALGYPKETSLAKHLE